MDYQMSSDPIKAPDPVTNIPPSNIPPSNISPEPEKKGIPMLVIISIIVLALLIVGGIFAYLYFTAKPAQVVQPMQATQVQSQQDQTTDWKTYDSGRGFEIKYPDKAEVSTTDISGGTSAVFQINSDGRKRTFEVQIISNPLKCSSASGADTTNVTINGTDFVKYYESKQYSGNISTSAYKYCVVAGNAAYNVISRLESSNSFEADSDPILNSMLSTFKLTNSSDQTAGWQTYTNAQYGFLLKYPTLGYASVLTNGNISINWQNNSGPDPGSVYINVKKPPTTNDACVDLVNGGTHVTINGIDFIKGDVGSNPSVNSMANLATYTYPSLPVKGSVYADQYCAVQNGFVYRITSLLNLSTYGVGINSAVSTPTHLDFENNTTINQVINSFQVTSQVGQTAGWQTYTNAKYGFSMQFPDSWKGYVATESTWQGNGIDNPNKYSGPMIGLKNPILATTRMFGGIPIMVITPDVWALMEQEKIAVSAAPIGPGKIGQNAKYIFATPPRWIGFGDSLNQAEIQEVGNIIKTFKAY